MATTVITGVRKGLMDGDFIPQKETDAWVSPDGLTYYFTGPLQTYNRAKYITDNLYHGIFYWDMGNDVPVKHKYNLAKWCSYGLNANVDTLITHVDVKPFDPTRIEMMHCTAFDNEMAGKVQAYDMVGKEVGAGASMKEILEALPRGMYVIKGRNHAGKTVSRKVSK